MLFGDEVAHTFAPGAHSLYVMPSALKQRRQHIEIEL